MSASSARVSILLPTFNRAAFLPAAFEAILGQTLSDWELVVIDDGSTDDTPAVLDRLTARISQPVKCVRQSNAGAYAARNRALDLATTPLVAFYDSDDLWLPAYLEHCAGALDAAADVDWVYAACRIVQYETGRVLAPNTFVANGRPRPFRRLRTTSRGMLRVFDDDRVVACALRHGLYCGLQNSVIRRSVFDGQRFEATFRNEAEDQLFTIRTLKRGHRLAYLDEVQVQYHVHVDNSSAAAADLSVERQIAVYRPLVRGFEQLRRDFSWSRAERRELARRLARDQFWHLGYAVLWRHGRRAEALDAFRRGLREWPWSLASWKTYLLARVRVAVERG